VTVIRHFLHSDVRRPGLSTSVSAMTGAALCLCLAVAGCARSQGKAPEEPSRLEALVVRSSLHDPLSESQSQGRDLFAHYCAICHGVEGKGDGFNSTNLDVPPRDFASPDFSQTSDERAVLAVSKGGGAVGKSVLMPSWGRTLNDHQIRAVVAFLRTLTTPDASIDRPADAGPETE
jgi:cytochrome c oxidase cbb3-type subunit III